VPSIAGGRQLGFTNHPNFLAAGTVLGLPFAFWLMASTKRREPLLGAIFLIGLLGGVYSSGSRGGAVCALFILAVCFVLHPRTRGYTPTIALAGIFVVGVVAVVVPAVGHAILVATRLAGGSATQGSDTVRSLVGAQGVRDFTHSPIQGIGLQASFDASEVYLQELASGGLILFAAMQIYLGGAILTAWRNFKRNDMSMAVLGSLLAILVLNFFEADLTDRFYYVPAAILIAMVHTLDADEGSDEDAGGAVAERNPIHAGDPAVPHRQPAHLRR
jgi:O-antigen ligase